MKNFLLSEGFDLVFFTVIFFIIVFFVAPYFYPQLQSQYSCNQHNGDYKACIKVQQLGKGCAWYADCRTCIKASEGMTSCK